MTRAKSSPLLDLLVTIIVPSVILMKLSDPESLGAVNALLLALAFPLSWGARSQLRERRVTDSGALLDGARRAMRAATAPTSRRT